MSTIKINIVSSSEEIFSGEATMVYATGTLGELGIAPGHTPLLTGLAAGPVRVQNGSEEEAFFCSGWLMSRFFIATIIINLQFSLLKMGQKQSKNILC